MIAVLLVALVLGALAFAVPLARLEAGPPPGADAHALEIALDAEGAAAVEAARVLTDLGSLTVVGPVLLLGLALLIARRDWPAVLVLVLGTVITVIAVGEVKAAEGRQRPTAALEASSTFAYPSGHAAQATAYLALALALARAHTRRTMILAAAALLVVVVAATRVYLRVHWLTDVIGGVGLAAATYATLALGLLAVAHLRHNPATRPDE